MSYNIKSKPIPWAWHPSMIQENFRGIAKGLMVACPMWEPGGPVIDVVRGFRSTIGGVIPRVPSDRFGRSPDLELADSDYFEFAQIYVDQPINVASSLSVLIWTKLETNATEMRVVNKWDGADGFILRLDGSSGPWAFFIDTGAITAVTTTDGTGTGVWHQIVGTYDSTQTTGNHKIHVDGLLSNTADKTGGAVSKGNTPLRFGTNEFANSAFLDGLLGAVMMWNRPLLPYEIRRLYQDPFGIFRQDLQVWAKVAAVAGVRRIFVT